MPLFVIAMAIGLLLPLGLPVLPFGTQMGWRLLALALALGAALAPMRQVIRLCALVAAGSAWTLGAAIEITSVRLPASLSGCDWQLEGVVIGLPRATTTRLSFDFSPRRIKSIRCPHATAADWALASEGQGRLRLSAYNDYPVLAPGDQLRIQARLRSPRGNANPAGFDYEAYLARNQVIASGYVRAFQHLEANQGLSIDSLRNALSNWLASEPALRYSAQMRALVLADHRGLESDDWEVLRRTGTVHLLVVSGLHISLAAGFGWLLGFLGALLTGTDRYWWAASASCTVALIYSLAAGFGIAAQRALVMVLVFAGVALLRRHVPLGHRYLYSLVIVLLMTPLAPLGAGFWLSFGAVLVLLVLMTGVTQQSWNWPARLLVAQAALTLMTIPLLIHFQGAFSLAAPLANLVAVPWLSFLILPVLLFGIVLDGALWLLNMSWAPFILHLADWLLGALYYWLDWLVQFDGYLYQTTPWWLLMVSVTVIVLLPLSWYARVTGVLLWGIALLPATPAPAFRFVVLDVGQGLGTFIQWGSQAVVYDVGPRYGSGFDAGRDILNPALRHFGVREVTHIIVSHEDLDHAGGLSAVRRQWPAAKVITSQRQKLQLTGEAEDCNGQQWSMGEIRFQAFVAMPEASSDNDLSCVLLVSKGDSHLLLPGDISRQGELALLERLPNLSLLVAAHHGSANSSDDAFLRAVTPDIVLYSAGWKNRFGHPAPAACSSAQAVGARLFSTARQGALELSAGKTGFYVTRLWRCQSKRWWRQLSSTDCNLQAGMLKTCP